MLSHDPLVVYGGGSFTGQITSSLATGTAPFTVASTTLVSNLNVERFNSQLASYYLDTSATAQTKAGSLTVTNSLVITSSVEPVLYLVNTTAAANNTKWYWLIDSAGDLFGKAANDALTVHTSWMSVLRTGTTVDSVNFLATALTFNGDAVLNGGSTAQAKLGDFTVGNAAGAQSIFLVTSQQPCFRLYESDQAADYKGWQIAASIGGLYFTLTNDAFSSSTNYLTIGRTGMTVGAIAFTGASLTFNGDAVLNSGSSSQAKSGTLTLPSLTLSSTAPRFAFYDSDGTADSRVWNLLVDANVFYGRIYDDAYTVSANWLTVTRSGNTISTINLLGTSVQANGVALATQSWVSGAYLPLSGGTLSGTVTISNTLPVLVLNETDAPLDTKQWLFYADTGSLQCHMYNDASSVDNVWLSVTRSGAVPQSITFTAVTLTNNGYIRSSGTVPRFSMYESDAAVDNRYWDFLANGTQLFGNIYNDAYGASGTWLTVSRSGTTISSIALSATATQVAGSLTVSPTTVNQFELKSTSGTQSCWMRIGYDADGTATPATSVYNTYFQSSGASTGSFTFACGNAKVLSILSTGLSTPQQITSTLATGTAPFSVASTTKVANLNVGYLDDTLGTTLSACARAHSSITGGGTISVSASSEVKWTTRFIVIANGNGSHFSTSGFFDIGPCPTSGTITGVGGAADVTATANGITVAGWYALYYILPIGSTNTFVAANLRIATYSGALAISPNVVLIASRNPETGLVTFCNGVQLFPGESTVCSLNSSRKFGEQIISSLATGTAPFSVASTTLVANLNVSYLNGLASSDYSRLGTVSHHTASFGGQQSVYLDAWARISGTYGTGSVYLWYRATGATARTLFFVANTGYASAGSDEGNCYLVLPASGSQQIATQTWAAPASHDHGSITSAGYLGSTANIPLITGTAGIIQAGSFGSAANTFCQGNDSRLSDARTPVAHNQAYSTINGVSANRILGNTGGTGACELLSVSSPLTISSGAIGVQIANLTAGTGLSFSSGSGTNAVFVAGTLAVSYGVAAGTACQGNDSRLSDARTPVAHNQDYSTIGNITTNRLVGNTDGTAFGNMINVVGSGNVTATWSALTLTMGMTANPSFSSVTLPADGQVTSSSGNLVLWAANSLQLSAGVGYSVSATHNLRPSADNTILLGHASFRWSNTYSVLGDFSGVITAAGGITISGAMRLPLSQPASTQGNSYFDTTNNRLWVYNGATWKYINLV